MEALRKLHYWKNKYHTEYSLYHVLKLTSLLDSEGPLGRQLISRLLKLGEGSVRGLIRKMKNLSLIDVDIVAGAYLTDHGRELIDFWRSIVRFSKCFNKIRDELVLWSHISVVCLNYNRGIDLIKRYGVLGIRDHVVRYGCKGAIITMFDRDGGVFLLSSNGKPDVDITNKWLGLTISKEIPDNRSICISGGSDASCLEAEKCVWDFIIDSILNDPNRY